MITFDFTKTAERLRSMMAQTPRELVAPVRHAVTEVETELAVQSILYLYDHLWKRDQFAKAACLLSECLPAWAQGDPRVRDAIRHAAENTPRNETLALELIDARVGILEVADEFCNSLDYMPPRARYWLTAVRLSQAATALEYGSGCGSNVFQCARMEGAVMWVGVDASKQQVAACMAQAVRLHEAKPFDMTPTFYTDDDWKSRIRAFDSVALLHVLEHTAFPDQVLDRAERYLAPRGAMTVVVPVGPWSVAIPPGDPPPVSSHINVTTLEDLMAFVSKRGRLLDARTFPGPAAEPGAMNAGVVYAP